MTHFLKLSLLFSTLVAAPLCAVQPFYTDESGEVQKYADLPNSEVARTMVAAPCMINIGNIAVEICSVEADGSILRGRIAVNEETKGLTTGDVIGSIGSEIYRIESIELSEGIDGTYFDVVLQVSVLEEISELEANEAQE